MKLLVQQSSNFWRSFLVPLLIVVVMWLVFGLEQYLTVSYNSYGILPRDLVGLRGIIFSPFIHGDFDHLLSNTFPVLILGTAIYYFYPNSANYVFLYSILMTGLWTWATARLSFHIGASGLIYAWGAFLFASGALNKNKRMMGISLLIVFLYGSLVWGVLPLIPGISFESHLFGAIAGFILAYVFRKDGPQRKKYVWETNEEEYEVEFWKMSQEEISAYYLQKRQEKTSIQNRTEVKINYEYKPKSSDSA